MSDIAVKTKADNAYRDLRLEVRMSDAELERVRDGAATAGQPITEYARQILVGGYEIIDRRDFAPLPPPIGGRPRRLVMRLTETEMDHLNHWARQDGWLRRTDWCRAALMAAAVRPPAH